MKKLLFAIATLVLVIPIATFGGDVGQTPLRKTLIESVRSSEDYSYLKGTKFQIKRIWASGNWAYLCALAIEEHGEIQSTDGQPDLYQIVLKREGGNWVPVANMDGPTTEGQKPVCSIAARGELSEVTLKALADEQQKRFR